MSRLGLQGRLLLGTAVVGVLVAAVFGVLVWSIVAYRAASDRISISERSIARANQLQKLVLDLETGHRGFIVTGDESFLDPWESARREIPRLVTEFESLEGEMEDEDDARLLGGLVLAYLDEYSSPVVARAREDLEAARSIVAAGEGKRRVETIRGAVDDFVADEQDEVDERRRRGDRLGATAIGFGVAGLVGTVLLVVLCFAYLSRAVVTPVRRLAAATRRLAAGELSARVPDTGHRHEVGHLGTAFNTMAASLEESRDELETQNAELEAQQGELERAVSQLAEERDRVVALHGFSERLAAESEVETLALAVLQALSDASRADVGTVYAAGVTQRDGFRLASSRGFHPDQLPAEVEPGEGLAGRALAERRPVAASHGETGLRVAAWGEDVAVRHELHLPLVQGDRVLGVVTLARFGDPGFSRGEREALEGMAGQAAVALSNALALRRARREASVTSAVIDSTPDGIALTDLDGRPVLLNAPMRELARLLQLGLEAPVYEGLLAVADSTVDPEAYRAELTALAADPEHAESRHEFTHAATGRSFERYSAVVRDSTGAPIGRLFVTRETTTEREAERLKDELVATVSHELRTPLTSIIGYLELVLNESEDELSGEQRHFLEVVERNARRLLAVVGDLLFVAQVEAGRLTLELEPLDPAQLVAESVEAARPLAEAKEIELVPLVESGLRVNGDRLRLNQLLANLASNAVKFTPRGGEVEVRARQHDGHTVLEVSDTGIGIPREEQERLFERFFRSSAAASQAIQGTGLGLVICKAIAEAHGGSISFASLEGKGTTFSVALPLATSVEATLVGTT